MAHDTVLITTNQKYINPVGVDRDGDKIVLVQGVGRIELDQSMLEQLDQFRKEKVD